MGKRHLYGCEAKPTRVFNQKIGFLLLVPVMEELDLHFVRVGGVDVSLTPVAAADGGGARQSILRYQSVSGTTAQCEWCGSVQGAGLGGYSGWVGRRLQTEGGLGVGGTGLRGSGLCWTGGGRWGRGRGFQQERGQGCRQSELGGKIKGSLGSRQRVGLRIHGLARSATHPAGDAGPGSTWTNKGVLDAIICDGVKTYPAPFHMPKKHSKNMGTSNKKVILCHV